MDESLITKKSTGSTSSRSSSSRSSNGWRNRLPVFRWKYDAIAYGSPYQKAAALVDLAEDGIGIPEEILEQSDFTHSVKLYFIQTRFGFVSTLNFFALIILNFLEKPLWCASATVSCTDKDYYYLGDLPYLTGAEALIYEGITLLFLIIHTFFPLTYEGWRIYWKNPINIVKVISMLILLVDCILYALYLSPVALSSLPFRISPYVRVLLFILNIRDLRNSMVILAGMLVTYLYVLALSVAFLLFSSWLAFVIFEDTQQGKTIFTSYGITLYQMLILFTTSNNPDVWLPAYKVSRWYCLFFVLYILIGVYFVTNLILAVVYDSFKSQLVKQVSGKDSMKKNVLVKAFKLIDKDNVGFLDKDQCIHLFEELNHYRTLPEITREEYELIFEELDDSHDFKIDLDEFYDLCNAISLRFHKEDSPSWFSSFPRFYDSPASKKLRSFVRSPTFGNIVIFILIVNLVAVIIETTYDVENSTTQAIWQSVEFVFGWIYVLEMALKVYSYGFENYWKNGQNRFDFFITWIIVIGETIYFVAPDGLTFLSNGEWIRYLLLARMLRLIRILMRVPRYRAFVSTFLTLIPSLMPYLGTIFCVMCIYCSLGLQVFGGIVNSGNTTLDDTVLADDDYLLFNFNDYPNGMVTLFNLLVGNNWQDWMESYKDLTGTYWSHAYFISFYLITVLLLLNLVVAFVLEAFFAEMEMESSGANNMKEVGGKGQFRVVGTKSSSQRVDALLHHMLGSELGQSESPAS